MYEVDAVWYRYAIEGRVGMDHIGARTADDFVRFAVLSIEDVVADIAELDDVAAQVVITLAT